MTDELILQLGRVNPARLGVIARTTAFLYKQTDKDAKQIGNELGVDYLVEGSVRRSGGRVRLGVNLVEVHGKPKSGRMSSRRICRTSSDFKFVWRAIAAQVCVHIPDVASRSPVRRDAFDAYLKGRYLYFSFRESDMREGIGYLQRSVELDPDFPEAHVFLADTLLTLSIMGHLELKLVHSLMVRGVQRAVEIAPTLKDARAYRAVVRGFCEWEWEASLREVDDAVAGGCNMDTSRWSGFCDTSGAVRSRDRSFCRSKTSRPVLVLFVLHAGMVASSRAPVRRSSGTAHEKRSRWSTRRASGSSFCRIRTFGWETRAGRA